MENNENQTIQSEDGTNPENNSAETVVNVAPQPAADQPEKNEAGESTGENKKKLGKAFDPNKLGILNNVTVALTVEVGRAHIKIRDLLNLSKGSIIELNKAAGEPVDVYVNGKLISVGNVITANGKYCVRLTSMPNSEEVEVRSDEQ